MILPRAAEIGWRRADGPGGTDAGTSDLHIVLSLLIGARTEELRALTWSHVDLEGQPPAVMVWRSVRAWG